MKKEELKNIIYQCIAATLDGFDVAFDDSSLSDSDKDYILQKLKKFSDDFKKKVTDQNYLEIYNVPDLVDYANSKKI